MQNSIFTSKFSPCGGHSPSHISIRELQERMHFEMRKRFLVSKFHINNARIHYRGLIRVDKHQGSERSRERFRAMEETCRAWVKHEVITCARDERLASRLSHLRSHREGQSVTIEEQERSDGLEAGMLYSIRGRASCAVVVSINASSPDRAFHFRSRTRDSAFRHMADVPSTRGELACRIIDK